MNKLVLLLTASIFSISVIMTSCSKDDDEIINNDFVGTWQTEMEMPMQGNMPMQDTILLVRNTLELTATSYKSSLQIIGENGELSDFGAQEAELSASDNELTLNYTSVAFSDMQTGTLMWVNNDDANWTMVLTQMGISETQKATYSVNDDCTQLTITLDGMPTLVLTKQ